MSNPAAILKPFPDSDPVALRHHLLEMVRQEFQQFQSQGRLLDQNKPESSLSKFCQDLVQAIDRIEEAGDWTSSLFLKNTFKPMCALRQQAKAMQAKQQLTAGGKPRVAVAKKGVPEDRVLVYIALYHAQGHRLEQWGSHMRGLARFVIGRPIYATHEAVQQLLRAHLEKPQEAYAVVAVKKDAILTKDGQGARDSLGQTLVALADDAISNEHLFAFVHLNNSYHWIDNQFIPVQD
jgi:Dot/Icm secretion system protein IcmQ